MFVHLVLIKLKPGVTRDDPRVQAWEAGFKDPDWARRDPDLALLHGDPEFERLYPEKAASTERLAAHNLKAS